MLKIRVIHLEDGREELFEVASDHATIGRHPKNDVVVRDARVSTRHARIMTGVVVIDMGSTNGTYVGRERVDGARVAPGGTFRLGHEVELHVSTDGSIAPGGTVTIQAPDLDRALESNALLLRRIHELEAANLALVQEAERANAAASRIDARTDEGTSTARPDLAQLAALQHELDEARALAARLRDELDAK